MTLFVNDPDFTLYVGDALETLQAMPAESVHCCVTSPPYWGLRDYGTGTWEGGDTDCDHIAPQGGPSVKQESSVGTRSIQYANACGKCGATRVDQQLGLEPTPDEYVANMVAVFREVRRILRADGTLWLNIGDSYNSRLDGSHGGWNGSSPEPQTVDHRGPTNSWSGQITKMPAKNLVGIPWMLAFALRADGWILRSDIIWAKPNPMPESVTDRPTKAHEYLFLLTKSPRYFYDADAIREPWGDHGRDDMRGKGVRTGLAYLSQDEVASNSEKTARGPDGRRITKVVGKDGSQQHRDGERWPNGGRNKRSVWEIATEAYPDAHFATFPQALVEPCVKAGTSEHGCCPVCGAPWERETDVERPLEQTARQAHLVRAQAQTPQTPGGTASTTFGTSGPRVTTTGWRPSCDHHGTPVPCIVLDPFLGSGTTAQVARRLGRRSIGIELNPEYAQLAARRLQQLSLFAVETAEA